MRCSKTVLAKGKDSFLEPFVPGAFSVKLQFLAENFAISSKTICSAHFPLNKNCPNTTRNCSNTFATTRQQLCSLWSKNYSKLCCVFSYKKLNEHWVYDQCLHAQTTSSPRPSSEQKSIFVQSANIFEQFLCSGRALIEQSLGNCWTLVKLILSCFSPKTSQNCFSQNLAVFWQQDPEHNKRQTVNKFCFSPSQRSFIFINCVFFQLLFFAATLGRQVFRSRQHSFLF